MRKKNNNYPAGNRVPVTHDRSSICFRPHMILKPFHQKRIKETPNKSKMKQMETHQPDLDHLFMDANVSIGIKISAVGFGALRRGNPIMRGRRG